MKYEVDINYGIHTYMHTYIHAILYASNNINKGKLMLVSGIIRVNKNEYKCLSTNG